MKKITSILLSVLMLLSSASLLTTTASALESKDFQYDTTSAGTAVITDYEGKDTDIVIPGAIDGYKVTAIGSYSFAYNDKLENVTIPNGVKSIGNSAFYNCSKLKKVEIPESVTNIRYSAFEDDTMLSDITLPSKLTIIENSVLCGTGIKAIDIPENVKQVENYAFYGCAKLEAVSLPDSVKEIGSNSFSNCTALASVHLSKNLKVIPEWSFYKTSNLSSISFPSRVTKIGTEAFSESGLKSVSIGKGVQVIEKYAFSDCGMLNKIKVSSKNPNFSSKNGVFYNKKKTELITYPAGKTNESFTLSKKIKKISSRAFESNPNLKKVTFKKGLKTISGHAFTNTALKKVKLPSTLKKIGTRAFSNCENLTNLTIPTSVTSISGEAFAECTSLKKLSFKGNSKLKLSSGIFESCRSLKTVSAPIAAHSEGRLFFACTKLNKVNISKNVKKIYYEDYAECPNLNKVTIPRTVKKIGERAFGYINYYDYSYDKNDNLVIKGYKNSAAHKYAKANDFTFKKIK